MEELAKNWWILVVRGLLTLLFGVLVIWSPGIALFALVIMFGAWAFADGIGAIGLSFARAKTGQRWGIFLVEGLLSLAIGIATLFLPWVTAFGLYLLIAARAVVTGVLMLLAAVKLRKEIQGEWMLALGGAASVGFGILLMASPLMGVMVIVSLIATHAFIVGASQIALGVRLHGFAVQQPRLA